MQNIFVECTLNVQNLLLCINCILTCRNREKITWGALGDFAPEMQKRALKKSEKSPWKFDIDCNVKACSMLQILSIGCEKVAPENKKLNFWPVFAEVFVKSQWFPNNMLSLNDAPNYSTWFLLLADTGWVHTTAVPQGSVVLLRHTVQCSTLRVTVVPWGTAWWHHMDCGFRNVKGVKVNQRWHHLTFNLVVSTRSLLLIC